MLDSSEILNGSRNGRPGPARNESSVKYVTVTDKNTGKLVYEDSVGYLFAST